MPFPRMTTRRWMLAVAVVALLIVALSWVSLLVTDAQQKAADERWSNLWLRARDEYQKRVQDGVE